MVKSVFSERRLVDLLDKVVRPVEVVPTQRYQQIGIRSHGKGLFDKAPVSGTQLGDKRVFWIEPDCFILNIVFAWEQAIGRTTSTDIGKIASHRFPMYRPKEGKVDIDFLTYLFKTETGKDLLGLASPGGAGRNKTLGQNEFFNIKIRCPEPAEQRRIAEILSTWDRAIAVLEQLVANARAQKKALMQQLLTGKKRLPGFKGAWTHTTLGTRGTFRKGKGISRAEVKNEGLPCIRYGEIYTHHNDVIRTFNSYIDQQSANESQLIQNGDIMFTLSGETAEEIGKCVAFIGEHEAYAGGDLAIFSPKNDNPIFLAYLLNSPTIVTYKSQLGQGNSVVHISARNLGKLQISIPEREEQAVLGRQMLSADNRTLNLTAQLDQLRQEKSALMQQLLMGKRRVKIGEFAK